MQNLMLGVLVLMLLMIWYNLIIYDIKNITYFKMKEQHHNYDPLNRYTMKTRIGNWSEEWDL